MPSNILFVEKDLFESVKCHGYVQFFIFPWLLMMMDQILLKRDFWGLCIRL